MAHNTTLLTREVLDDLHHRVLEHRVKIELLAPLVIETLGPGEVLGWSWLFAPYRWQFDARAVGACSLVSFDGTGLRARCESDPELGFALMRCLAETIVERLQATRRQLLDVYGPSPASV